MERRPNGRRRDNGSVLPLVLVLMVIAGLIVVPLLGYAVAVFRSNRVVSDRTGAVEAAKGGVRMAVGDPQNVFLTCDGGGDLTPTDPMINGIAVTVICSEMSEVGPNEALSFEVPIGAVAMQLGAGVPIEFSGSSAQSPPVPPYPVAPARPDWWSLQRSSAPTDGTIWMPDLPTLPVTLRTSTPFDMPPAFDCKVFFPGRYTTELFLTGNVYFTSGVYYFEKPVNVLDDADVVVGYGLEDLPNPDCSDDYQVVANVIGSPGTYDIFGGGATWVFGKDGRLLVDDSTTSSVRLIFNQRYDQADRGGRISIMTVNGDDIPVPTDDHEVTNVNMVPLSQILDVVDNADPVPDTWNTGPIEGTLYAPSSSTYTDKARLPQAPTSFTATPLRYDDSGVPRGAILLTWDEVTGQAAGGAFIDRYDVTINGAPSGPTDCQPIHLVVSALPAPPGGNQVSCLVKGLTLGTNYAVGVAARNEVGAGAPVGAAATPMLTDAAIVVPDAPTNVAVVDSNVDDVARVTWDAPANGGAPITSYVATAHRIYLEPQPDQPPVAGDMDLVMTPGATVVSGVPAFDPNGDSLSLTVDDSLLDPAVGAVTVAGLDFTFTTTATAPAGAYVLPYSVEDPGGVVVDGVITIVVAPITSNAAPVAGAMGLAADVGVPLVGRVPVFDPNGDPLSLTIDDSALDPAKWAVTVTGLEVSVSTTAPDGAYSIPYTVEDPFGQVSSGSIDLTIVRGAEEIDSCEVLSTPGEPLANVCEIAVPDLVPGDATSGNVGYRFDVSATNSIGSSAAPGSNPEPLPLAFNGSGIALPPPAPRIVEPWRPVPIIEIVAGNGNADVEVSIAGYVAVPMGRIAITNPDGDAIKINGGVLAGTFDVDDARSVGGPGSLPIGFKNDIVLQRKVRIVATARQITAIAVVQVNEDGAKIRINSWVIQ